jgi:RNA polymerase sigma-70 factor (ECF subfamily)
MESSHTSEPSAEAAAFDELWRAIRAGRSVEYRQLVEDCTPHLLQVVRRRLNRRLRSRFDSIDFTQAVWASFVAKLEHMPRFTSADELRSYLAKMAAHKVVDEVRRQFDGQKRDVSREQPVEAPSHAAAFAERRGTPSQFAIASERLERLKQGRSQEHQQIIQMRLEGETLTGIASAMGMSERQVRRVLSALAAEFSQADPNASTQP